MEINERFITEVIIQICNGMSGAMVFIGLESKRYILCGMGLVVAIVMIGGIAHSAAVDCYGPYNERCTCEYNSRGKQLNIVCPTRPTSDFTGRNDAFRQKRRIERNKNISLIDINGKSIVVKKR